MEQGFRRSGIDNINSERYNQVLAEYHRQLSYNESCIPKMIYQGK